MYCVYLGVFGDLEHSFGTKIVRSGSIYSTILKLAGPLTAHERAVRFFMEESNITGK